MEIYNKIITDTNDDNENLQLIVTEQMYILYENGNVKEKKYRYESDYETRLQFLMTLFDFAEAINDVSIETQEDGSCLGCMIWMIVFFVIIYFIGRGIYLAGVEVFSVVWELIRALFH